MTSNRVVCPHCGEKLVLRKPAIESTKVKCSNCRGKFYAGHVNEGRPISISDDTGLPPALVEAPKAQRVERRIVAEENGQSTGPIFPAWLVPVGLVLLVGLSIAGLNSRPSVAPPPSMTPPTTFVSSP